MRLFFYLLGRIKREKLNITTGDSVVIIISTYSIWSARIIE